MSDVVAKYSLHSESRRLATGNALSNDTCLDLRADERGMERVWWWIRRGATSSISSLKRLCSAGTVVLPSRRRRIHRLPRRCERFGRLQRELITPYRPNGTKETNEPVTDVGTRWNSFGGGAERALCRQPAVDELLLEGGVEYNKYLHRRTPIDRPVKRQRPAILDDALTAENWGDISPYREIPKLVT